MLPSLKNITVSFCKSEEKTWDDYIKLNNSERETQLYVIFNI